MRTIEYPKGTHASVRARIEAIAWATNRRGRCAWKGENVTRDMIEYISRARGFTIGNENFRYVTDWLISNGYATKVVGPDNRMRKFEFLPDVDLNVTPDWSVLATDDGPESNEPQALPSAADVPLPGQPANPPPYRWDEFEVKLKAWAQLDPDAYARWIDMALDALPG